MLQDWHLKNHSSSPSEAESPLKGTILLPVGINALGTNHKIKFFDGKEYIDITNSTLITLILNVLPQ